MAIHVYRRQAGDAWLFEPIGGEDAILQLTSVDLAIPLTEIYQFA